MDDGERAARIEAELGAFRREARWLAFELIAVGVVFVAVYERGFVRRFGEALRDALNVPDTDAEAGEVIPSAAEVSAVLRAARDALKGGH